MVSGTRISGRPATSQTRSKAMVQKPMSPLMSVVWNRPTASITRPRAIRLQAGARLDASAVTMIMTTVASELAVMAIPAQAAL